MKIPLINSKAIRTFRLHRILKLVLVCIVLLELVAVYIFLIQNLLIIVPPPDPVLNLRFSMSAYHEVLDDLSHMENYTLIKPSLANPNPFLYQ